MGITCIINFWRNSWRWLKECRVNSSVKVLWRKVAYTRSCPSENSFNICQIPQQCYALGMVHSLCGWTATHKTELIQHHKQSDIARVTRRVHSNCKRTNVLYVCRLTEGKPACDGNWVSHRYWIWWTPRYLQTYTLPTKLRGPVDAYRQSLNGCGTRVVGVWLVSK